MDFIVMIFVPAFIVLCALFYRLDRINERKYRNLDEPRRGFPVLPAKPERVDQ